MNNDVDRLFASLGVGDFPYRDFQTGAAAGFPLTQAIAEIVVARRNFEARGRASATPPLFVVEGGEARGAASEPQNIGAVGRSRA